MNKRIFPTTRHHRMKYEYMDQLHSGRMLVRNTKGMYGFVDSNMKEVLPCIYDYAQSFCNGRAAVVKGYECGLIDTLGHELIPCMYSNMRQLHRQVANNEVWTCGIDRYVVVHNNLMTGVYNLDTKEIVPLEYDPELNYNHYFANTPVIDYQVVNKRGVEGMMEESGKMLVPLLYGRVNAASDGMIRVEDSGRTGFYDTSHRMVVGLVYDEAHDYNNGMAAVRMGDKWGYIDKRGNEVIGLCYEAANDFGNGVAVVKDNSKYGLINKAGVRKMPCIYDAIQWRSRDTASCKYGVVAAMLNGRWALADTSNRQITAFRFNEIVPDRLGYLVSQSGRRGFISKSGTDTTGVIYSEIETLYNNIAMVRKNDKWGALDSNYKQVLPDTFGTSSAAYSVYYKGVPVDGKKLVFAPGDKGKYRYVLSFSKRRAAVENTADKYGYINKRGKEVIPCVYDYAGSFVHKKAWVLVGEKQGYINKRGRYVVPLSDSGELFYKGTRLFQGEDGRHTGMRDKNGKIIMGAVYNFVSRMPRGRLIMEGKQVSTDDDDRGSKYGCVDYKGNVLLPFKYDFAYYGSRRLVLKKEDTIIVMNKRLKVKKEIDPDWELALITDDKVDNGTIRLRQHPGFNNGLVVVSDSEDRQGCMNVRGKVKVRCRFSKVEGFNNGRSTVRKGYNNYSDDDEDDDDDDDHIDTTDINYPLHFIEHVETDAKSGMINKRGKLVMPYKYDVIADYVSRTALPVKQNNYNAWGFVNKHGRLLTPHMFINPRLYVGRRSWVAVSRNNMWVYIDRRGKARLQFQCVMPRERFSGY